jgi:valyl-tRNA synthetase
VRLYEKGLIYRGPRLINWSPGLKTAVSDLEVEYSEEDATLYYFKYKLKDSDEFIPVATIRPETILGDTAVAVHPDDERYKKYVGQSVIVPVLGREIPVIADHYVSREFGTGALKVTPGHDPNDYLIAQRHNLPVISVLDEAAQINENGGPYKGQDRFDARKNLWADMKKAGLVIRTEPYRTTIPRSQRGGEIVEPMISTQWFVKIEPLAQAALEAVKDGRIRIVPERFEKVYFNWLDASRIRDWCISRQLWWGHRIPVWYCPNGHMTTGREDPTQCATCGSKELTQDEDVLDTWFSSGLWPFSTLGWPDETPDYKYFYPTTYMETGYDILFFWVARMIMLGLEFTGQVPFNTVYLHGLVRDEIGRKISKTTGNVIDPLILMDEFGTDALRFTMLVGSTPGNDTNVGPRKVEANRNFANKLWNAGRFVISAISNRQSVDELGEYTLADSWIWAKLQQLVRDVERLFQNFQYGQAGQQIYDFIWSDFADWYVEIAKQELAEGGPRAARAADTLARVFDISLRLLHPFTPFVTEELWGHLRSALRESPLKDVASDWPEALIVAKWPEPREPEGWEESAIGNFTLFQDVVRAIRNQRAEKNVKSSRKLMGIFVVGAERVKIYQSLKQDLATLAGLDINRIRILEERKFLEEENIHLEFESIEGYITLNVGPAVGSIEIFLPLAELGDPAEDRARLEKELKEAQSHIVRLEKLLSSDFANKAPAALVQKEREKLAGYKETAEKIKAQLT